MLDGSCRICQSLALHGGGVAREGLAHGLHRVEGGTELVVMPSAHPTATVYVAPALALRAAVSDVHPVVAARPGQVEPPAAVPRHVDDRRTRSTVDLTRDRHV